MVNEEQPTRSWGEFQREAEASLANMSSRNGGGSEWLLEPPDYWESAAQTRTKHCCGDGDARLQGGRA